MVSFVNRNRLLAEPDLMEAVVKKSEMFGQQEPTAWIREKLSLPLVTIPEAGVILGFQKDTAYLMARNGDIPVMKFGSRFRVRTSWIKEQIGEPSHEAKAA